jgi:hypothetical protein
MADQHTLPEGADNRPRFVEECLKVVHLADLLTM